MAATHPQKSDYTNDALFADQHNWKWCNRCEGFRPRDKFHTNKWMKDGLQGYCVDCFKRIQRESHENFGSRLIANMVGGAKSRAVDRGVPFTIENNHVQEQICKLAVKDGLYMCPRLDIPLIIGLGRSGQGQNNPTLDAIRPKLGYVPGNIQIVSRLYNSMKSDVASEEEWVVHVKRAIENIENEAQQTTKVRQAQGTNGVTATGVLDRSEQDTNVWLN